MATEKELMNLNQNKMKHSKELTKWIRKRFWNEYILYRNRESFETYVKKNYIKEIHSINHHTFKSENEKANN